MAQGAQQGQSWQRDRAESQAPDLLELGDDVDVFGLAFDVEALKSLEAGERREGKALLRLPDPEGLDILRQVVQAIDVRQRVVEPIRAEATQVWEEAQEVQVRDRTVVRTVRTELRPRMPLQTLGEPLVVRSVRALWN